MKYSRYNNSLKPIARHLRNEPTCYEKILWNRLRKKQIQNVQFYRQVPIGTFILDFYAKKLRLAIEVDGEYHLSYDMQDKDLNRDDYLSSIGIQILRFSNKEIEYNLNIVVAMINTNILNLLDNYHEKF
ncbi:MAG: endonuclease domain-containing protein [Gammaproteobacteria bacterium]|jgi:very-short-patch-repair endonuclease